MEFTPEKIYLNFDRKIYWTRVHVKSESGKELTILVCASRNFISDLFGLREAVTEEHAEKWLAGVLREIKAELNEESFNQTAHYKVYANSKEGKENGLEFLKREATP